jgi:hypothetical protein
VLKSIVAILQDSRQLSVALEMFAISRIQKEALFAKRCLVL